MRILPLSKEILKETYGICAPLFRILVPMIIVIKILEMTGLVSILGAILQPVMHLAGLPGELGLAWASAILTNLYGGVIAFAAIAKGMHLTVAQTTVMAALMLMAHGFPVELQIAKKAGTRFRAMMLFRFCSALLYGVFLNVIYSSFNLFQEPVSMFYSPKQADTSLFGWAYGEVINLCYIAFIILTLVIMMRVLKKLGVINMINTACKPLMKLMGMGEQGAYLTMVGFTMGLTYGGGLIIKEARSGSMSHRDVFFSLGFMGICHGMVEDTVLMLAIGGEIFGILIIRTIFAILLVGLLVRLTASVPEKFFYRWFFVNR